MVNGSRQFLRRLLGCGVFSLGLIAISSAQVPPDPPSGITIDGSAAIPGTPGNTVFFDDFGYVVNKFDSAESKIAAFTQAGWSGVKDERTQPGRASGYLSTVNSVPGYSGLIPGRSGRALRMEGLATTMGDFSGPSGSWRNQTDFYLTYGTSAGPQTNVPGNVWYQFWIYVNDYGNERSQWSNRNKLIYPSDDGTATGAGTENAYLISLRPSSQEGIVQDRGARAYVVNKIEAGNTGTVSSDSPEGPTYIGANLRPADGYITPNRWHLYKVHVDHASVNGRFEVWHRPMGGSWVKTTEWIGGVTPGFTWITQSGLRAGHNLFKMPTTWGTAQPTDNSNYDAWVYMADFAMASRESDLPVYQSY
jgi:hypothetical protein